MTDKYTIRDVIVYTTIGLVGFIFLYIHYNGFFMGYVNKLKNFSEIALFLLVPISYVLGHIIYTIDNIVFNLILYIPIKYKWFNENTKIFKIYNFIFYGNRNMGVRRFLGISTVVFLETCDKLLLEKNYEKAEYYQVISDLCKGLFLISSVNLIINILSLKFDFISFILPILFWFRGREFSQYYVNMIIRNIKK